MSQEPVTPKPKNDAPVSNIGKRAYQSSAHPENAASVDTALITQATLKLELRK